MKQAEEEAQKEAMALHNNKMEQKSQAI